MTVVTDVIENALALPLRDRLCIDSKHIGSLEEEELSLEAGQECGRRVAGWRFGQTQFFW
jgi:hypothetical protein